MHAFGLPLENLNIEVSILLLSNYLQNKGQSQRNNNLRGIRATGRVKEIITYKGNMDRLLQVKRCRYL